MVVVVELFIVSLFLQLISLSLLYIVIVYRTYTQKALYLIQINNKRKKKCLKIIMNHYARYTIMC